MAGRRLAAGLAAAVLLLLGADGGCGGRDTSRCPALARQHAAAYAAMHRAPTGSAAYRRARARYLDVGRQMRRARC